MKGYLPQCHSGQYQCQKTDQSVPTRCIPQEWRCNGMRDCENNDDESGCSTDQLTRGRTQAKCTQEQYQCHGTGINSVPPLCIERRFVWLVIVLIINQFCFVRHLSIQKSGLNLILVTEPIIALMVTTRPTVPIDDSPLHTQIEFLKEMKITVK